VVRESYHTSGYNIVLRTLPWKRAIYEIDNGISDVIYPAVKNSERIIRYYFSAEHVHLTNVVLYTLRNAGFNWNGLGSLFGKKVCVIPGWAYGEKLDAEKRIEKHGVSSIKQCFAMHEKDRVCAVIGYEIPFDYYLK
jgi:polar amino acid transport system substrate-binding protein